MDSKDKKLLDVLLTWSHPRVEVGYCETGINKPARRCFAIGELVRCDKSFIGSLIGSEYACEIVISSISRRPFFESGETLKEESERPVLIHIPTAAIFSLKLLIPEDSDKVIKDARNEARRIKNAEQNQKAKGSK